MNTYKIYNTSEKRSLVKSYYASGQSKSDYCRSIGLAPSTFSKWLGDVRYDESSSQVPAIYNEDNFIELGRGSGAYEISYNNIILKLPTTINQSAIVSLMKELFHA